MRGATGQEKRLVASWPMWGGSPARNMVNTVDKNMPTEWDVQTSKNVKWTVQIGTVSNGNPVIADGKIFIGTNNGAPRNPKIGGDKGILMCFRQSDGKFLWQAVHDKLQSGKENDWPDEGVASASVVEGKRLYYVSNRCTLVCADTEGFLDGKNDGVTNEKYKSETDADVIWELDMIDKLGVYPHFLATSSPLVVGDLVYVITSNGPDENKLAIPAPNAPSFIAVHKADGRVVWQDNSPGDRLVDGQWGSPTYGVVNGKGQVYFPGGDGWLYAFEPLGDPDQPGKSKLIWKFDCNPPGSKGGGVRSTANSILSTAVFHDNRVYIGTGQNPENGEGVGHLYAIDATKTGDVSEFIGPWDPVNRCKDPAKSQKNPQSAMIWHFGDRDFGRTLSTCAVHGDFVVAAEASGFLHCLDRKTGKPLWRHDMLAGAWGSPYIVDGKIYMGDEDGDVSICDLAKEKNVINEVLMNNTVFSTPVAVDGVLYIRTKTTLYAIEQK
jgi:outer membrane protein assembly factor BamB